MRSNSDVIWPNLNPIPDPMNHSFLLFLVMYLVVETDLTFVPFGCPFICILQTAFGSSPVTLQFYFILLVVYNSCTCDC